jgi:TPR repeat protein
MLRLALWLWVFVFLAWGNSPSARSETHEEKCAKSDKVACLRVAIQKEKEGELTSSKRFSKKACDLGYDRACYQLAKLLNDEGSSEAPGMFLNLCERNEAEACASYGIRIAKSGNKEDALKYFNKSCELKCALGCAAAGKLLYDKKDFREAALTTRIAKSMLETECAQGNSTSCGFLREHAESIETYLGSAAPLKPKPQTGTPEERCQKSDAQACLEVAIEKEENGDRPGAKHFSKLGCAAGEPVACINGALFLVEDGLIQEAKNILFPLCMRDIGLACFTYATTLIKSHDSKEGLVYFKKSCELQLGAGCASAALILAKAKDLSTALPSHVWVKKLWKQTVQTERPPEVAAI